MDAAVDDGAQRGARARAAGEVAERVHGDARADRLEPVDRRQIDARHVRHGPAQRRNRRRLVDGFERVGCQLVFGRREAVLLERPALFGDQLERRFVVGGRRVAEKRPAAGELADA